MVQIVVSLLLAQTPTYSVQPGYTVKSAQPTQTVKPTYSYDAMRAEAIRTGRPLVIYCGYPERKDVGERWLTCNVDALVGYPALCVVVCEPRYNPERLVALQLYEYTPSTAAIRAVLGDNDPPGGRGILPRKKWNPYTQPPVNPRSGAAIRARSVRSGSC